MTNDKEIKPKTLNRTRLYFIEIMNRSLQAVTIHLEQSTSGITSNYTETTKKLLTLIEFPKEKLD